MRGTIEGKGVKVDLVLSGGAARGIVHIGVLKALEEIGVEVSSISCVSAGAIVGTFYSIGYTPEEMMKILRGINWFAILRPKIPKLGFISLKRAEKKLREFIDRDRIEDLEKKLIICAVDIKTGETLYFSKGDLIPILLGSCALPGIFEPIEYEDYLLIDGGITNNLPVEPLVDSGRIKIGVEVNPVYFEGKPKGIISILVRSFLLAVRSNIESRKEMCDIIIEPDLRGYTPLDIGKMEDLYRIGYETTMEVLKDYVRNK